MDCEHVCLNRAVDSLLNIFENLRNALLDNRSASGVKVNYSRGLKMLVEAFRTSEVEGTSDSQSWS
jgi:hypothetical protein